MRMLRSTLTSMSIWLVRWSMLPPYSATKVGWLVTRLHLIPKSRKSPPTTSPWVIQLVNLFFTLACKYPQSRQIKKINGWHISSDCCSNDGQEFNGSIYQKCSDKLDCGVQLAWTAGSNATKFGLGAKYNLDKDACVRAKVNNASQVGLGYQQKLRDGEYLGRTKIDIKYFDGRFHSNWNILCILLQVLL